MKNNLFSPNCYKLLLLVIGLNALILSIFFYCHQQNAYLNNQQLSHIQALAKNCPTTQRCYGKVYTAFEVESIYRLKKKDFEKAIKLIKSHSR